MSQPNQWGAADRSFGAQTYGNSSPALIAGRFIDQITDIRPQDVPTNGIPALFPMNDQSMVVAKYWDASAEIKTVIFKRDDAAVVEQQLQQPQKPVDPFEMILAKMQDFENMLNDISKSKGVQNYYGSETNKEEQ